jgi:N utilization substance protein B
MTTYNRRLIRERVLQVLYAHEISKEPIEQVMQQLLSELRSNKDHFEFAKKLIFEVLRNEAAIEELIKSRVAHWELERIALIDRMLLRMGICELVYFEDIPPKVTINESIEVAKIYSTENSGKFVNGVLDAVLEDLKQSNKLKKSGRGLVESTTVSESRTTSRKPSSGKS